MPPEGPIEVLLNDDLHTDVHLVATAVAQRPLRAGEGVTATDLVDLRYLEPVGIDPNAGWLAFANVAASSPWPSTFAATGRPPTGC